MVAVLSQEVHLPLRTRSQQHGRPTHWAVVAKERKQQRYVAGMLLRQQQAPRLPCIVTLIRISPRRLDDDNLRSALKSARDEVAIWLGLPKTKRGQADDRDPRVAWKYQQGTGKEFKVIVKAESVTQAEVDAIWASQEYKP